MKATKITQKCQSCGGDLVFAPAKDCLVCRQCGNIVPVTGDMTFEKSFQKLLINAPTWQDTAVYQCEHCGAKSLVTKYDLIAKCDYCGATSMIKTGEMPGIRPDTVLPFTMNQADAGSCVRAWLAKRFFVPNDFKHMAENRRLRGIYFPAFTFDAHVVTKYTAVAVRTETYKTIVDGKEVTKSRTVRRPIVGSDIHVFDDLLVSANEEIPPQAFDALQPFDTGNGQVFQQSYLAGFTVAQASKDPTPCWETAKESIENVIRHKITTRYSGTTIEDLRLDMGITNVTYKYVLLPVYVGRAEYKGTQYHLFLNGQTGKIYGKTPKSKWKIFSFFAVMGLLAVGVGIFLATFL